MKNFLIILVILTSIPLFTWSKSKVQKNSFPDNSPTDSTVHRVVFYNVENLFYPIDDSLTFDDDFTPSGSYHWTFSRYRQKLNSIAKVLIAIGEGRKPAILGLCEIENRKVLEDLCNRTLLKSYNYKIIHKESGDPRGIDVALLYDPEQFFPENYDVLEIFTDDSTLLKTREILKVKGSFVPDQKMYFFINHWPSRRGGKLASEKKRIFAAGTLRKEIDRILDDETDANIILMGDFNDEPEDASIKHTLGACGYDGKNCRSATLINIMYHQLRKGKGTHFMKNNFYEANLLDQLIISRSLFLNINGIKIQNNQGYIFKKQFLLNEKNGVPFRTFQGLKYLGGISDHLPVYLDIIIYSKKNE